MNLKKTAKILIAMLEFVLKNTFFTLLIFIFLFALYVEIDSYKVLSNADSSNYQSYKPVQDDTLSFEQLKELNPDVIGWITINDTSIDYPIVQGSTNETYINTSVFGEFSLTGAIFLDWRNKPDFTDTLSIIYGHNMIGNAMFGGIDLFKEEEYFNNHLSGTLYCNGNYYTLKIFACFKANGYDFYVYKPSLKQENYSDWLEYICSDSIHLSKQLPQSGPILLMSTCSSESTDGRTLLAASISKGSPPLTKNDDSPNGFWIHLSDYTINELNGYHLLILGLIWLLITVIFIFLKKKKKGNKNVIKEQ